ncbi:hypothetical protein D8M34_05915 [Microbacterium sp. HSID17254]|uniref:hypothetical protein n=1 Tax=Microbacterium sp. HSID17254 TaxID=2419509 RepID=UPI000F87C559|nr:hypothetical protein [Microbacterium sp. HSID17254]RUQ07005.1 hypothetical protein D8M34_05915 [Microbacterium sp. HSID17254]
MQIALDVFTVLLAAAALIVSIRAMKVAKNAPLEERTRSNRDEIREALLATNDPFFAALYALDRGRPVGDIPDVIPVARDVLDRIGPRLPEEVDLVLLRIRFDQVVSRWNSVTGNVAAVQRMVEDVSYWDEQLAELDPNATESIRTEVKTRLAEARREEQSLRDEGTALRMSLREALTETRDASTKYISSVDEKDKKSSK